jgi:8-oxo-dGTP diphosphatase
MAFSYKFPRPAVTVDCVVFGLDDEGLKVLLIKRGIAPFKGAWALPGGFVRPPETLEQAAIRELSEETGLKKVFLEQLYTFGDPGRDPRGRVISVSYFALVNIRDHEVQASTDAREARWCPIGLVSALAFDHQEILRTARLRIQGKVRYQPIGFELLPEKFTLSQLQHLYETILARELDKRNFRRKILEMGLLMSTGEKEQNVSHRAAQLFHFDRERYEALVICGFNFEL